jgi:hypothetical protein
MVVLTFIDGSFMGWINRVIHPFFLLHLVVDGTVDAFYYFYVFLIHPCLIDGSFIDGSIMGWIKSCDTSFLLATFGS